MRIVVEELPIRGRDVVVSATESWARDAARLALDSEPGRLDGRIQVVRAAGLPLSGAAGLPLSGAAGPLRGAAFAGGGPARLAPGELSVSVRVRAAGVRACDRCGADVELVVACDDALRYVPEGAALDTDGDDDGPAELVDVGWYADGVLELGDVLSEALTLHLPARVVCADVAACDAAMAAVVSVSSARPASPASPAGVDGGRGAGDAPASGRPSLGQHPALAAWKQLRSS